MPEMPPNNPEQRRLPRLTPEQYAEIKRQMDSERASKQQPHAAQQPRFQEYPKPNVAPHRTYAPGPSPSQTPSVQERTSAAQQYRTEFPVRQPQVERTESVENTKKKRKISPRATTFVVIGALVAGGSVAATAGHDTIAAAIQGFGSDADGAGVEVHDGTPVSPSAFLDKNCKNPENSLMVATVSAEFPLIPMVLSEKNPKTTADSDPYMLEKNIDTLPQDQQESFKAFANDSGYLHANVVDLPLALTVCIPQHSKAITKENGKYTVDFTEMNVQFQDPKALTGVAINAQAQVGTPDNVKMDTSKGEWMNLPHPDYGLFLDMNSKDKIRNESSAALVKSYQTQEQLQVILAETETQIVEKIDSAVNGEDGISFPNGAKTLQDAVAASLIERITGKKSVAPNTAGLLTVSAAVPVSETTKKPITAKDPKTGASPLKQLDADAEVTITEIKIQNGSIAIPKQSVKAIGGK